MKIRGGKGEREGREGRGDAGDGEAKRESRNWGFSLKMRLHVDVSCIADLYNTRLFVSVTFENQSSGKDFL